MTAILSTRLWHWNLKFFAILLGVWSFFFLFKIRRNQQHRLSSFDLFFLLSGICGILTPFSETLQDVGILPALIFIGLFILIVLRIFRQRKLEFSDLSSVAGWVALLWLWQSTGSPNPIIPPFEMPEKSDLGFTPIAAARELRTQLKNWPPKQVSSFASHLMFPTVFGFTTAQDDPAALAREISMETQRSASLGIDELNGSIELHGIPLEGIFHLVRHLRHRPLLEGQLQLNGRANLTLELRGSDLPERLDIENTDVRALLGEVKIKDWGVDPLQELAKSMEKAAHTKTQIVNRLLALAGISNIPGKSDELIGTIHVSTQGDTPSLSPLIQSLVLASMERISPQMAVQFYEGRDHPDSALRARLKALPDAIIRDAADQDDIAARDAIDRLIGIAELESHYPENWKNCDDLTVEQTCQNKKDVDCIKRRCALNDARTAIKLAEKIFSPKKTKPFETLGTLLLLEYFAQNLDLETNTDIDDLKEAYDQFKNAASTLELRTKDLVEQAHLSDVRSHLVFAASLLSGEDNHNTYRDDAMLVLHKIQGEPKPNPMDKVTQALATAAWGSDADVVQFCQPTNLNTIGKDANKFSMVNAFLSGNNDALQKHLFFQSEWLRVLHLCSKRLNTAKRKVSSQESVSSTLDQLVTSQSITFQSAIGAQWVRYHRYERAEEALVKLEHLAQSSSLFKGEMKSLYLLARGMLLWKQACMSGQWIENKERKRILANSLLNFDKGIKEDPESRSLRWERDATRALLADANHSDISQIISSAKKSAAENPLLDLQYYALGTALFHHGDTKDAVVSFRRAVELDPENQMNRHALGLALIANGDIEEGRSQWEYGRLLDPANWYLISIDSRGCGPSTDAIRATAATAK